MAPGAALASAVAPREVRTVTEVGLLAAGGLLNFAFLTAHCAAQLVAILSAYLRRFSVLGRSGA